MSTSTQLSELGPPKARYADVPQLALQHPDKGIVFEKLRAVPTQRLLNWRNKPQADPCIAFFVHEGSPFRQRASWAVQSVAVFEAEGAGRIVARWQGSKTARSTVL